MYCFLMRTLQDVVFQWLTTDSIPLNQIDAEDPEVSVTWLPSYLGYNTQLFKRLGSL